MRVQITEVHMVAGGTRHEHIAEVKWKNIDGKEYGTASRQEMVAWLRKGAPDEAWVYDGTRWVRVHVMNANPPYIQTYADSVWTDNLLALPRY